MGKGFAVVAEEIRKLAERSDMSSKEIAQTIGGVTQKIKEAAGSRDETSAAFSSISSHIDEVSASITSIRTKILDMQESGKQVIGAMGDLRGRSGLIQDESRRFGDLTHGVMENLNDLSRISNEVVANIGEIGEGISFIGGSVRNISELADRVEQIGNDLDTEIKRFKIKDVAQAPEDLPIL
jgi:methyl-accepting chemotaxis protein